MVSTFFFLTRIVKLFNNLVGKVYQSWNQILDTVITCGELLKYRKKIRCCKY